MKQFQGIWLPDHETHLVGWMSKSGEIVDGRGTYQINKLRAALKWVKRFRVAVDVGAHCGMWSMQLAKRFAEVHAFEPVAAHRECWLKNMGDGRGELHPCALGAVAGTVAMHTTDTSSGDSWVDGDGDIPMGRLDTFALKNVDFIKLDCEGYELLALRGGESMLKSNRPCVIVEQKPGRAQKFGLDETEAVTYLQSLGATLREELSGDFIMSWDTN